jgi:hypothetical protein
MSELFEALWAAPLSRRGTVVLRADGTADILGSQHGETVVLAVTTVPGLGVTVTLRETGGSHWAGRGARSTHGPQVDTILLDGEPRIGTGMVGGRMWRFVELGRAEYPRSDAERLERGARLVASADLAQYPARAEVAG